jgi:hypothetical protein
MHKIKNMVPEEEGTLMGENINCKFYFVCTVTLEVKTLKK